MKLTTAQIKALPDGTTFYALTDLGRMTDAYTTAREAIREANARNDLPDVVVVRIVGGKIEDLGQPALN